MVVFYCTYSLLVHCWQVDTDANIHVCADVSLLSSYQGTRDCSVLMGNGSHASVPSVGTLGLWENRVAKEYVACPAIKKDLVSGSLLCN